MHRSVYTKHILFPSQTSASRYHAPFSDQDEIPLWRKLTEHPVHEYRHTDYSQHYTPTLTRLYLPTCSLTSLPAGLLAFEEVAQEERAPSPWIRPTTPRGGACTYVFYKRLNKFPLKTRLSWKIGARQGERDGDRIREKYVWSCFNASMG